MICCICKLNPVKLPMATTCSLECSLSLDTFPHVYDGYAVVRARLNNAVAAAKIPCNGRNKGKV